MEIIKTLAGGGMAGALLCAGLTGCYSKEPHYPSYSGVYELTEVKITGYGIDNEEQELLIKGFGNQEELDSAVVEASGRHPGFPLVLSIPYRVDAYQHSFNAWNSVLEHRVSVAATHGGMSGKLLARAEVRGGSRAAFDRTPFEVTPEHRWHIDEQKYVGQPPTNNWIAYSEVFGWFTAPPADLEKAYLVYNGPDSPAPGSHQPYQWADPERSEDPIEPYATEWREREIEMRLVMHSYVGPDELTRARYAFAEDSARENRVALTYVRTEATSWGDPRLPVSPYLEDEEAIEEGRKFEKSPLEQANDRALEGLTGRRAALQYFFDLPDEGAELMERYDAPTLD